MSSPIQPISTPAAPTTIPPYASSPAGRAAFQSDLAAFEAALAIDATRGGPPAEVLDQMEAAHAINARLYESGFELRFAPDHPGGSVRIELYDSKGKAVRAVTVSEAFEIASGTKKA